jgi:hypothetical protein
MIGAPILHGNVRSGSEAEEPQRSLSGLLHPGERTSTAVVATSANCHNRKFSNWREAIVKPIQHEMFGTD